MDDDTRHGNEVREALRDYWSVTVRVDDEITRDLSKAAYYTFRGRVASLDIAIANARAYGARETNLLPEHFDPTEILKNGQTYDGK